MLSEIPKTLSGSAVVGYLFPSTLTFFASGYILYTFDVLEIDRSKIFDEKIEIGLIAALIIWTINMVYMAMNRTVVRILEGYGRWNPIRALLFIEKRRFRRLINERQVIWNKIGSNDNGSIDSDLNFRLGKISQILSTDFPNLEEHLMPTRLGNIMRSFEVYSFELYSIDSVVMWPRLLAVIPDRHEHSLTKSKMLLDFWVNISFGTSIALIIWSSQILNNFYLYDQREIWATPIIALPLLLLAKLSAESAAREWGAYVKSSFDLFKNDLAKKLGYRIPISADEERALWFNLSQSFAYTNKQPMESILRHWKIEE